MKIYIDFDGTLFDTFKLKQEFINLFNKYNVKKEYIEKIINESYQKDKNLDILAKKIIEKNNLDSSILTELDNIYSKKLIYKDAIPFLEKYYQKYDLILLTLGTAKYQQKKINASNISKYFKKIIITNNDKSKLNIDYNSGIFIDNNPLELKKFYNSHAEHLIRIKRDNDKYSKLKKDINSIVEFTDFNDLLESKYIEKIGEFNYE